MRPTSTRNRHLLLSIGLLAMSLASLPGCIVLAAGAGVGAGATWYYSSAKEEVDADPSAIVSAAVEGLEDMGMTVESQAAGAVNGKVSGKAADDDRVQIMATLKDSGGSHVEIRVGYVDDDAAPGKGRFLPGGGYLSET